MAWGDMSNHGGEIVRARAAAREREQKRLAEVARREVIDGALNRELVDVERGQVPAMRRVISLLAERHNFTIEVREAMPDGAVAFAQCGRRNIVIPPIVDAETFAVALHEAGHILAERCTRRAPHQPDPTVTRWSHCLKCETDAWEQAMRLVPFSKEMHDRLRSALKTYRRSTPGPASEVQRLDELSGTIAWRLDQQRRRKWQMRCDAVARWKTELERERLR